LRYHRYVILYLSAKFRPNRTIRDRVMTSYSFFKMAAVSHIELFQSYCRPPTKCKWRSQVDPLNFDSIGFIVLEIMLFCVMRFWLCLFTWLYPLRMRRMRG